MTTAELVERHRKLAYKVVRTYSCDAQTADEIEGVALLALVKAASRFDPERGVLFSTYGWRTVHGEISHFFRNRRRYALRVGGELPATMPVQERGFGEVELRDMIDRFPSRQRAILHYTFVEGMTQAEIAPLVGVSQVHVSRLLAKSLAALRKTLVDA